MRVRMSRPSRSRRNVRRGVAVGMAVGAGVALASGGRRVRRRRGGGGMISAGITLIVLGLIFWGIGTLLKDFLPESAGDIVFIAMIGTAAFFGGLGILFLLLGILAAVRFARNVVGVASDVMGGSANNTGSNFGGNAPNHCRNCGAPVAGSGFCQGCGTPVS